MSIFKKTKFWHLAITGLILVLVLLTIFVYLFNNPVSRAVTKVFPYPVAFVGTHLVTLGDYYQRVEIVRRAQGDITREAKTEVLDKLIGDEVVELEAKKRGVNMTGEDVQKYYEYLQTLTGKKNLGHDYGLSEASFKQAVIVPDLRAIKVQQSLSKDKELNSETYSKLQKVQAALGSGISLETTAQQYSDDKGSGRIGGDIGFVSSTDVVPEFYEDIAKVQDQDVHLFTSRYGIHVYKVYGKDTGANGVTRYHVKQIFLKTQDFNSWLEKARNEYRIVKILK